MDESVRHQALLFSRVLREFERDPEGSKKDLIRILTQYFKIVWQYRLLEKSKRMVELVHQVAVDRVSFCYSLK